MNAPGQPELERRLAGQPVPEPPPDLLAKLKADIPAALPAPHTARRHTRPMPWQWLAAASILVAVGGGFLAQRVLRESPRASVSSDRPATDFEAPQQEAKALADAGTKPETAAEGSETLRSLAPPPPQPPRARRALEVPKPQLVAPVPESRADAESEPEPVQVPDEAILFDEVVAGDDSGVGAEPTSSARESSQEVGTSAPAAAAAAPARGRVGSESELRKEIQQPVAMPEGLPSLAEAPATVAVLGKVIAAKRPLVGATVTASSPDLDGLFTTHTNQDGEFSLTGLRPGAAYELRFELTGFEPITRQLRLEQEGRVEVGTVEMEKEEAPR